jgi:2-dehydropantoate 2-reductase
MYERDLASKDRPTFAVLGVGAVGGLYGGLLAKAGYDVHFLARSDFDHLQSKGLQVDTPLGDFHLRPKVYREVQEMPQVDCVIVSWKTTANRNLGPLLAHFAPSKPIVLVLQNGLNIEQAAADVVGEASVLGGCCFLCSNKVGSGHIKHLDYGRIAIGAFDQTQEGQITEAMKVVGAALSDARIEIQLAPSLAEIRWKKLAWNIPFNGLSVALSADTSAIMNDQAASQLAEELMIEVVASAQACGVTIGRDHIDKMLNDTRKMVPYASSMLLDYQAGRPMEIEAIFGNPIRAAKASGFTPARIEMLYRQLSFLDSRARR